MEDHMRSVTDSFHACLATIDQLPMPALVIDDDGSLIHANRAWLSQVSPIDAGGPPWDWCAALADDGRLRMISALSDVRSGLGGRDFEVRVRVAGGGIRVLDACAGRLADPCGADPKTVIIATDVTERHRSEERLAFMAGHDPLTGLANRRTFEEALDRALSRAERGQRSSLLMLDMDHLKSYNDTHGHLEGDQALVNFTMLLRKHVRAGDLLARLGGDEFGVLLEGTGVDEAAEIAERMRKAASEEEFVAHAREHDLGISAGLVAVEPGVVSRALLDRADIALYSAKAMGRNRIVRWGEALAETTTSDRTASRVREAFRSGGYTLVFQPVVRLVDGSVSYYESFVRLRTPEGETLLPGEFLAVVERLGLMPRLTRLVLGLVLDELRLNPETTVSVNLSASDLADEPLLDEVERRLSERPDEARRLVFEIAEAVLANNAGAAAQWLLRLRAGGASFVLDDFGTGAGVFLSECDTLIEQVKLAPSVIAALGTGEPAVAFVEALRRLMESQGRTVVAACVETDELLERVTRAGFTLCQGFRVARPHPNLRELVASEAASALERVGSATTQGSAAR